jgi:hypothetical protein
MHGGGERTVTTTIRIDAWTNKRRANDRSRLNHIPNAQTKGDAITMKYYGQDLRKYCCNSEYGCVRGSFTIRNPNFSANILTASSFILA